MPVDGGSSSASTTVAPVTGRSDVPARVSVSSSSSTTSFSGVRSNVPVALISPASMVIAKSGTGSKSTASAAPLPDTDTVTVVASVRALPRIVAVTATGVLPASSRTRCGSGDSAISNGASSSSARITSDPLTGRSDRPVTESVSSASSTRSSSGASVNVPVPLVPPAAMVIAKSGTGSKPTTPAAPLSDTDTVTVVACCRAASKAAVTTTAVSPAPSSRREGFAVSLISVGASSSSSMKPTANVSSYMAPLMDVRKSRIDSVPSWTSSSITTTGIVRAEVPTGKVNVPLAAS